MTDLDTLEALAADATREPWDPWGFDSVGKPSSWSWGELLQRDMMRLDPYVTSAQAQFIAAADPETIGALFARVRDAEKALVRFGHHDSHCAYDLMQRNSCICGFRTALRAPRRIHS